MAKEMTRRAKEERKLKLISQLPEFIKIVHNYFISEKKVALKLESVIMKTQVNGYGITFLFSSSKVDQKNSRQ